MSPRVNLVWRPTGWTTLHAGYARYFSPPPFELVGSQTVANFVNTTAASPVGADTTPYAERTDYFDVGVSQKLERGLTLGVDSYYKASNNLIDKGQFGGADHPDPVQLPARPPTRRRAIGQPCPRASHRLRRPGLCPQSGPRHHLQPVQLRSRRFSLCRHPLYLSRSQPQPRPRPDADRLGGRVLSVVRHAGRGRPNPWQRFARHRVLRDSQWRSPARLCSGQSVVVTQVRSRPARASGSARRCDQRFGSRL